MRTAALILLVMLFAPPDAGAQTMATLTTAAVSSDGEGGLFMLAGGDAMRVGVHSRFLLSTNLDLGLQLAFDRHDETGHFGGGADLKYHLPIALSAPIDFAIDAGAGLLESSERRLVLLSPGILVSGRIESGDAGPFEAYMGLYALFTRRTWKKDCEGEFGRGCESWERSFFGQGMLRAGVKVPLRRDFQVLVEMNVNGETMFGAGLNVVF